MMNSNSDDQQTSHQRVTMRVTSCKENFYIKTEENTQVNTSHHFFYYKNDNLISFIYFVATHGDSSLSNAQFQLKYYGDSCGDSW